MKKWLFVGVFLALALSARAEYGWDTPVTGTSTGGVFVWTNVFKAVSASSVIAVGGSGAANTITVSIVNGSITSQVGVAGAVAGTARLTLDPSYYRVYTSDKLRVTCVTTGPVVYLLHNFAGE